MKISVGEIMKNKKGFTLLELLVVVLIIGILASIALPQYRMAVTKARVASILPLMRRWKDALMEYKLQHGDYEVYGASSLGVNWPSDWDCSGDDVECWSNDGFWHECFANEDFTGQVYCSRWIDDNNYFVITMYQPDDLDYEKFRDKIACYADGDEAHKICKALGGELPEGENNRYILY